MWNVNVFTALINWVASFGFILTMWNVNFVVVDAVGRVYSFYFNYVECK